MKQHLGARSASALVVAVFAAACATAAPTPPPSPAPVVREADAAPTRAELARALGQFVREHPNVPGHTPDALFRLALLSEEAARDRCEAAPDVGEPCEELGRAIARLVDLFERFPDYDHSAGVIVHAGFLEFEREHVSSAARAWLALVCANRVPEPFEGVVPSPPLPDGVVCEARTGGAADVGGAWLRLGELWFDGGDAAQLEAASRAFGHAVETFEAAAPPPRPDPRDEHSTRRAPDQLAELARYKRAWSLYRLDRYGQALGAFAEVGAGVGALAAEARQYAAICIAERDWDGDGEQDAVHGVARPEVAAHLDPATLHALASVYRDEARYGEARAAWQLLLARHRQAPEAAAARAGLAALP